MTILRDVGPQTNLNAVDALSNPSAPNGYYEQGPLYSLQDPNAPSPVDYFNGVNPMGDYTGFDTNPFNSATVYPGADNVWSGNGWSGDAWDVPGTSLSFGSGSGGSAPNYSAFDVFGAQGAYDTGSIDQLTTFGTDPSDAWASASDWSNDPVMGAGFDWTATDVAGVGFDSGSNDYSGGYTSDATQSYTPYETTNTIFADPADYYGGGYDTSSYSDTSWSDTSFSDASYYGGGGYSDFPVILDLGGGGIDITQLSDSNTYFDMAGDGRQHRTAWAGTGDAMLVLDLAGTGQITERNQIVFTDWDPTASSDMQALSNVFDTNHNNLLDAGDAQFSAFKLMVSNADGTKTLKTFAQAGVTSIGLTPDATKVLLPD
ncbi:MAG: hypothetical protein ABL893_15085, partial [Hyphomicrobium sp.]